MIKLKLDIEREFKLDLGAMKLFEKLTGESIFEPTTFEQMNAEKLSALLYAGLKRGGCELTQDEVDGLITPANMQELSSTLLGAMNDFAPVETEEKN